MVSLLHFVKAGTYKEWIARQIKWDLTDVTADQVKELVIAYEPIWAIGTGETATADQAQEVCKMIREVIAEMYDQIQQKLFVSSTADL